MSQASAAATKARAVSDWLGSAALAYIAVLWGSLVVILLAVGRPPTLDGSRPGDALAPLALVTGAASFLGRGASGVSGATAGAASAYGLAIITAVRAAERNWAFIAPGPSSAWQASVTDALLRSLLVLAIAALVGAVARELREWVRGPRRVTWRPAFRINLAELAVMIVVGAAAFGGTSALVAAAAETSIVMPAPVPTVRASGQGAVVTVTPASMAPGEVQVTTTTTEPCELCAGGLDLFGPLSDDELGSLRIGRAVDDWINRLPRPSQLWYGGVSLRPGRYAFAYIVYPGPDEPPRLEGVGILAVEEGPMPAVVARTPGDALRFVALELLVVLTNAVAVALMVFRRRRPVRPGEPRRWWVAVVVAAVVSIALVNGLALYVQFAGSPF